MLPTKVYVDGREIEVNCEEESTVSDCVKLIKLHFTLETLASNRSTQLMRVKDVTTRKRRASISVGQLSSFGKGPRRVSYLGDTEQECDLADDDDSESGEEQELSDDSEERVIERAESDGASSSPRDKYSNYSLYLRNSFGLDVLLEGSDVLKRPAGGEQLVFKEKPLSVKITFTREFVIDGALTMREVTDLAAREFAVEPSQISMKVVNANRLSSPRVRLSSKEPVQVFGVARGGCNQGPCDCTAYQPGTCSNCGHYPAQHQNHGSTLPARSPRPNGSPRLSHSPRSGPNGSPRHRPARTLSSPRDGASLVSSDEGVACDASPDATLSKALTECDGAHLHITASACSTQLGMRDLLQRSSSPSFPIPAPIASGGAPSTPEELRRSAHRSPQSSPSKGRGSPLPRHLVEGTESPKPGRLKRAMSKVFSGKKDAAGAEGHTSVTRSKSAEEGMPSQITQQHSPVREAGVYGARLADMSEPPKVILDLTSSIYQGLQTEGLFRKSGNQERINAFKAAANEGSDASDLLSDMDFHDRACALKQYLQSLPDCLLTSKFYSRFKTMAKMSDTELQIDYLKCLFVSLPASHRILLRHLLDLLAHVRKYSEINLMGNDNLAIVFGPILMLDEKESADASEFLRTAERQTLIVQTLLEFYSLLKDEDIAGVNQLVTLQATSSYRPSTALEQPIGSGDLLFAFKEHNELLYFEIEGRIGVMGAQVARALSRPFDAEGHEEMMKELADPAVSPRSKGSSSKKNKLKREPSREKKSKKAKG